MSRESPLVRVGPVTTTPGHPFLAARKTTTRTLYSPSEGRLPRGRRPPSRSQVPEWVPATQLQGLFLASPTAVTNAGAAQWACDPWLAGRYTADGWTSSKNGIMIAVGSAKVTDFEHECGQLPWTVSPSGPNCYRYTLCDHEMATELRTWFGHGAAAKTLPAWLLSADEKDRRRFLAGYLSGDGSATANGWHANTVSAHLACQIRLLALGLGFASQVREVRTPATTIIEGRTVSQRNYWTVTINRDATRYGVQQDGKYWFKQRRPVTSAGFATVYDLTVEEDHSFIAWGYVVHNCQHWSRMSRCRPGLSARYPDLITPSRPLLEASGRPWVIENVSAARTALRDPVALCIFMFGRKAYRHRLFETGGGFTFAAPPPVSAGLPPGTRLNRECGWPHPVPAAKAGHWQPGMFVSVSGHERKRPVQEVMETPWMRNREDVKEAIPPYFTRYLGGELLRQIG